MQSDGGLASVDGFSGHKAILSGPAGGYVGYALTTRWHGARGGGEEGAEDGVGMQVGRRRAFDYGTSSVGRVATCSSLCVPLGLAWHPGITLDFKLAACPHAWSSRK
jgi:hypothetical protein